METNKKQIKKELKKTLKAVSNLKKRDVKTHQETLENLYNKLNGIKTVGPQKENANTIIENISWKYKATPSDNNPIMAVIIRTSDIFCFSVKSVLKVSIRSSHTDTPNTCSAVSAVDISVASNPEIAMPFKIGGRVSLIIWGKAILDSIWGNKM